VILGEAIGESGPAIILSFVLAGVTCAFSALAYAELASSIPVSGSAYTYAYATMGELMAWIIGWDLILEYGISVAAVAVGWGQYFNDLLDNLLGITLPESITNPPGDGGTVNIPAAFLVLAVTALLIFGVRETARANTIMVFTKVGIILLFIVLAFTGFSTDNLSPFAPEGSAGVVTAASLIFFAYIGFDAISTSGEETKNPRRDLPIAILAALGVCTLLYILVALTASAALPYTDLAGKEAPLAEVLRSLNMDWGATVISFGALVAITSVVLTILYGQTRIMFAMSRDGLVPRALAKISPTRRTPVRITALFGVAIAIFAALVPLTEIVKLVNIGTLFAFVITNIGVIVLRRTRPDLERGFKVPFVPLFPLIGAGLAIYLMFDLELATWLRFAAWMAFGLILYFAYGMRNSRLRRGEVENPEAQLG
jgi:APA family basic amino acid/polyamine antiporter